MDMSTILSSGVPVSVVIGEVRGRMGGAAMGRTVSASSLVREVGARA